MLITIKLLSVYMCIYHFVVQGQQCSTQAPQPVLPEDLDDIEDFSSSDESYTSADSDSSFKRFSPVTSEEAFTSSDNSDNEMSESYVDDEGDSRYDGRDTQTFRLTSSGKLYNYSCY